MAHAGTMVGGSAQTKQSGSPWAAIALAAAVVVATIAGVWLASSAGLVGGTAKPAADRSYDQIEAQRGAITLSGGSSQAYDERLNGILDGAHAAPYVAAAVTLTGDDSRASTRSSVSSTGRMQRRRGAGHASSATSGTFHPALPIQPSATSGTFHPGKPADQVMAPAKRDRVGGP